MNKIKGLYYGVWNCKKGRWCRDIKGRQFITDTFDVAADSIAVSNPKTVERDKFEVREMPPEDMEYFEVKESTGGEQAAIWTDPNQRVD